jgi:hypothetical protein
MVKRICSPARRATSERWATDHDHKTGHVRGILCTRCNTRLPALDDTIWVLKAIAYLEKFK